MSYWIKLCVNEVEYKVEVDPSWSLVYVLREKLGLTGTKMACAKGTCGSCTVLIDGKPIFSCIKPVMDCVDKKILTIEGLNEGDRLHPIQQSYIDNSGFQCGYCTPGMILATKALLDMNSNPTKEEARGAIAGHICRCGAYPGIIKSILGVAQVARCVKDVE